MNLRQIANRATQRINPNLPAQVLVYSGTTKDASYKRSPAYAAPVDVNAQVQALTKDEIKHLDALNIGGTEVAAYVNMQLSSVDRVTGSGGDIVTFGTTAAIPDALKSTRWLVSVVLEGWTTAGWCRVGLTRQMANG